MAVVGEMGLGRKGMESAEVGRMESGAVVE